MNRARTKCGSGAPLAGGSAMSMPTLAWCLLLGPTSSRWDPTAVLGPPPTGGPEQPSRQTQPRSRSQADGTKARDSTRRLRREASVRARSNGAEAKGNLGRRGAESCLPALRRGRCSRAGNTVNKPSLLFACVPSLTARSNS